MGTDVEDLGDEGFAEKLAAAPVDLRELAAPASLLGRNAPVLVKALFAIRQSVVGLVGISRGSRSVFDVKSVAGNEALPVADDRHLDFRCGVGIDVERRLLRVTTVVRLTGWRGRASFAPVSVLHGPITRAMAKRAVLGRPN